MMMWRCGCWERHTDTPILTYVHIKKHKLFLKCAFWGAYNLYKLGSLTVSVSYRWLQEFPIYTALDSEIVSVLWVLICFLPNPKELSRWLSLQSCHAQDSYIVMIYVFLDPAALSSRAHKLQQLVFIFPIPDFSAPRACVHHPPHFKAFGLAFAHYTFSVCLLDLSDVLAFVNTIYFLLFFQGSLSQFICIKCFSVALKNQNTELLPQHNCQVFENWKSASFYYTIQDKQPGI